MMLEHLRRMARYNQWANRRLYAACGELPSAAYHQPRAAFFGSIHGTLSHLLVTDRIWLARIEGRPNPDLRLDDQPYRRLDDLEAARGAEDTRIIGLVDGLPGQRSAAADPLPIGDQARGRGDPAACVLAPPVQPSDPSPRAGARPAEPDRGRPAASRPDLFSEKKRVTYREYVPAQ
jgi:uncharacterized damage-inducible protein DinB